MQRISKHNKNKKNYRKTKKRGAGDNNKVPPLPPSPIEPNSASLTSRNVSSLVQSSVLPIQNKNNYKTRKTFNRGVTINPDAGPVQPNTFNKLKRNANKKRIMNVTKPKISMINRYIFGIKTPEPVPLDAYGYPIKSAFNINKENKGFVPNSKP